MSLGGSRRLRIVHLLSNWKWTERSEPAANAAAAEMRLGHDVRFIAGRLPDGAKSALPDQLASRSLTADYFDLPKHLRMRALPNDIRKLRSLAAEWQPDIVHCHMLNAHLTAALSFRGSKRPRIVRSCYEPDHLDAHWRSQWLLRRATDGLIVIADSARREALDKFGVNSNAVHVIEPGVDLDRFDPARTLTDLGDDFGLPADAFVIGIVSRLRPARRPDLVLEAVARLRETCPRMCVLVIGRGTPENVRRCIDEPAQRLGIADRVHRGGYCLNDRLVAAFRAMQAFAYPTPGTDPSCRTVREAMASGVPIVGSRMGYIPHLVRDGATGIVTEPTAEAFAAAFRALYDDHARRRALGDAGLADARRRFNLLEQARRASALYESLLAR